MTTRICPGHHPKLVATFGTDGERSVVVYSASCCCGWTSIAYVTLLDGR